jgi:hypothetical protein
MAMAMAACGGRFAVVRDDAVALVVRQRREREVAEGVSRCRLLIGLAAEQTEWVRAWTRQERPVGAIGVLTRDLDASAEGLAVATRKLERLAGLGAHVAAETRTCASVEEQIHVADAAGERADKALVLVGGESYGSRRERVALAVAAAECAVLSGVLRGFVLDAPAAAVAA